MINPSNVRSLQTQTWVGYYSIVPRKRAQGRKWTKGHISRSQQASGFGFLFCFFTFTVVNNTLSREVDCSHPCPWEKGAPKHQRSPNSSHECFCPCKAKWLNMVYFKALLRDRGPGDSIWLPHYSSKPYTHRISRQLELSNVGFLYLNAVTGWDESRGRSGTRRWPVGSLELSLIAG